MNKTVQIVTMKASEAYALPNKTKAKLTLIYQGVIWDYLFFDRETSGFVLASDNKLVKPIIVRGGVKVKLVKE